MKKIQLIHDNYGINEKGHFTIGGVDTVSLAKEYGTPLYVIDEKKIRSMCRIYQSALKTHFKKARALYASKALCFRSIYPIINDEGFSVDVVSSGELFTAISAGFPVENIYFHGNNKTESDIRYALEQKVGCFVVDNITELILLDKLCAEYNVTQKILLRLTPGIDPETNKKIITGSADSKFGMSIETGQAKEITLLALSMKNLSLKGFHCHIGSQIFEDTPFSDAAGILISFISQIQKETDFITEVLNLGGGFGVRYIPEQKDADIDFMIGKLSNKVKSLCDEYKLSVPEILIEPGRSIVASSGITLYTVGAVKTITGYKNYISVDGGMTDNPRYALYESPYYSLIANKASKPMDFHASIAGRCCESGDLIQENIWIQKPCPGDILAVTVTGAYNYSMASNYNRLPKPALVLVNHKENETVLAVKRESFEDLIKNEFLL